MPNLTLRHMGPGVDGPSGARSQGGQRARARESAPSRLESRSPNHEPARAQRAADLGESFSAPAKRCAYDAAGEGTRDRIEPRTPITDTTKKRTETFIKTRGPSG